MKLILLTLTTVALAIVSPAAAQTIYTGHWDISAHPHLHGSEMELEVGLHNHGTGVEYELPGPQFHFGFGNSDGTGPAPKTNLLIGSNNYSVWISAHDEEDADLLNQPFIGFSAGDLGDGWSGNVTFTLSSLLHTGSGAGNLFLFEGEDVFWNSTSLVGGNYGQFSVLAGQHGHGEFAFSDEGLYELTLLVSGTYNGENVTSSPTALNINVVPEPSSGALLLAGVATLAGLRRRIRHPVKV